MRRHLVLVCTAAVLCVAAVVQAQEPAKPKAAPVTSASDYYQQSKPADSAVPAKSASYESVEAGTSATGTTTTDATTAILSGGGCCSCNGCDCCDCGFSWCGGGCLCDNSHEGCSYRPLPGAALNCWNYGGWTQLGYTNNNQPLSQAYNDLLSFNDVPDGAMLNQQWLYFGKKADGSCGFDFGGRIDLVYGTDAQKTQAFGNPGAGVRNQGTFDASMDHSQYGWAIPQLYAEVAYGDLSVKAGHFFTLLGYEHIASPANFFYSRTYSMYNSLPFTHTGVLATYTGLDNVNLYGGWVAGWDTGFDQLNQGNAFLSGFTATLSDWITVNYSSTFGNFGWRDGGSDNSYSHALFFNFALTDRLSYILENDMIRTDNPGVSQFDTVGFNNYLIYQFSDMIGVGVREEWWKADGVSFNAITGGANIRISDNFLLRPEYRWDWAPGIGLAEGVAAIDVLLIY